MNIVINGSTLERLENKVGRKVDLFGKFYDLNSMSDEMKNIELAKLILKANSMLKFNYKPMKTIKEENLNNQGTAGWKQIGNHLIIDNDGDMVKVFSTEIEMFDYITVISGECGNSIPLRPSSYDDWYNDTIITLPGGWYVHTDVPCSSSYNMMYNVCYIYDEKNNFVECVALSTK